MTSSNVAPDGMLIPDIFDIMILSDELIPFKSKGLVNSLNSSFAFSSGSSAVFCSLSITDQ